MPTKAQVHYNVEETYSFTASFFFFFSVYLADQLPWAGSLRLVWFVLCFAFGLRAHTESVSTFVRVCYEDMAKVQKRQRIITVAFHYYISFYIFVQKFNKTNIHLQAYKIKKLQLPSKEWRYQRVEGTHKQISHSQQIFVDKKVIIKNPIFSISIEGKLQCFRCVTLNCGIKLKRMIKW